MAGLESAIPPLSSQFDPPSLPARIAGMVGPGLLFSLAIGLFALLKLYALHPVAGDENIYFYLANRTAQGLFPYRDFVFTHPPLQIFLMAFLALISNGSFWVLKAAPAVFVLAIGLVLWGISREKPFRDLLPGPYLRILPLLFFWFSYDTLRIASHYTGTSQATLFLLLGWWLCLRRRPAWAGACFAASMSTAVYIVPLVGLVVWWCQSLEGKKSIGDPRALARIGIGGGVAILLIHLPVWIVAPGAWWEQTVMYHARKPPIGSSFGDAFSQFLAAEGFQAAAALLVSISLSLGKKQRRVARIALFGLIYIFIFVLLQRVYIYYFLPAFPFLALGSAIFLRDTWRRIIRSTKPLINSATLGLGAALLIQPLFYWNIPSVRQDPWKVTRFEFRPTPGIGPLNQPISWIFPSRRLDGLPAPGILRYLWHENSFWEESGDLARELDRTLPPAGTLYGDSTTAPLLAFLSHRRLACELADTNTLHFRIGTRSVQADLDCAKADRLSLLVVQPRAGINLVPEFNRFVTEEGVLWRESTAGKRQVKLYTWKPSPAD